MTIRKTAYKQTNGHRITLIVALCLFGLCAAGSMHGSQEQVRKKQENRDKRQEKAEKDRVYLLHADQLRYDMYKNPEAQILTGNVAFRHNGATMYCDSAYFYEMSNSFKAFGNVKMYQGDTLSLFSEYAYYDGNEQMAEARYNVVLKNRKSTLYTDSLNYDRLYNIGYFFDGGKLVDQGNTLTADWGEYHTDSKEAIFNYDVKLRGQNFILTSDTLYYNTNTSMAHAVGPSNITSGKSKIYTEDGYYDTKHDKSKLYARSVVTNNGKTIIGDSVYHDSKSGTNEAFRNVVYTDTVNKNKLTCDYCFYNEQTGYGMATKKAVTMDFSQKDTLYMHADTFKIYTYNINTDSVYRVAHAYNKVRAYRTDVQAVCDSLVYNSKDSCMTMYRDPIVWNVNQQLLGEMIKVYMKDSTINRAHVINQALSVEQMHDSVHFNQLASTEMFAYFNNGEIYEAEAIDNVLAIYHPIDDSDSSLIAMNYMETTKIRMFLENRRLKRIWAPKANGVFYPMTQIPPDKKYLPNYAWFDYIRPLDKDDIFNWRSKKAGTELKEVKRREAPVPKLPDTGRSGNIRPNEENKKTNNAQGIDGNGQEPIPSGATGPMDDGDKMPAEQTSTTKEQ